MRTLNWLWRGFLFFVLFAFALNNQHLVELKWFMGYKWQSPMVIVVLAVFALGCVTGVLAMVPIWWHHRREARQRQLMMATGGHAVDAKTDTVTKPPMDANGEPTLPPELPFPPDMPAPRPSQK